MIPRNVDKEKYESKPINLVNGMPWPRIGKQDTTEQIHVPLKK